MPEANVKKIKAVADEHGVIIDIRPTTPHAEPMLREGTALPKPEKLKAKTINEVDVQIGLAKQSDLGKVGFFDPETNPPRRPADYESLPPKQKEAIDDRIAQRLEEFDLNKKDMFELRDKELIRIEPDGTVINTGLTKGKGELPFTGDHDVFDIRAKDGTALSPEKYKEVVRALKDAEAGVMHGGVVQWSADSPDTFFTEAGQKSYGKMMADHSPGGKDPLVRIGEGDPKAVWYEPAAPRAAAGEPGAAAVGHAAEAKAGLDPTKPGPRPGGTDPDAETTGVFTRPSTTEPEFLELPDGSVGMLSGAQATDRRRASVLRGLHPTDRPARSRCCGTPRPASTWCSRATPIRSRSGGTTPTGRSCCIPTCRARAAGSSSPTAIRSTRRVV
jgi:hypothetical protein